MWQHRKKDFQRIGWSVMQSQFLKTSLFYNKKIILLFHKDVVISVQIFLNAREGEKNKDAC